MQLKDMANCFHLTVNQFCTLTGYSRQGLHQLFNGKTEANKNRMAAMLSILKFSSDSLYSQDIAEAVIQKNTRERFINEIAATCGVELNSNLSNQEANNAK